MGEEVSNFQKEFAAYIGACHGVGVGSGTDALHIGLRTCGIGPGDIVITAAHTAVATVAAIELSGATPTLVDIDPVSFTIDPNRLEEAAKNLCSGQRSATRGRLKAVIPVHLYGHPADMESIISIGARYGFRVIEDCAQSHGAVYKGRKTGAWGAIGAFSFYPTKNLACVGDGGMILTDDPGLAERARMLREYGWQDRYVSKCAGVNSRLDELQAAILRVKLGYLDKENEDRRVLAKIYDNRLNNTPVHLPVCRPEVTHVYHQYVVQHRQRDDLRAFLRERGIGTLVHYPVPIHLQPAYRGRVPSFGELHNSEETASRVLSLPVYPELSPAEANSVADAILAWDGLSPQRD